MRYAIWGPVVGLVLTAILFLLGVFGNYINAYLITGAVLVGIGLIAGIVMDKQA